MSDLPYAGDIFPADAWSMLLRDPNAMLIDTRTEAEFCFVGGPDLSGLPNSFHRICWKIFPDMARNPHFEDAVRDVAPDPKSPILFLCRSGVRSAAAATALTALGYENCFNIAEGFEGDKDGNGHRGTVNGWKVRGLPWVQD